MREGIWEFTAKTLDSLRSYNLDLIVLSKSVGVLGQTKEMAERRDAPGPFLQLYLDFARRRAGVPGGIVPDTRS